MVYLKYLAVILHKIAQICTCYVINGLKMVIYRISTSGHNRKTPIPEKIFIPGTKFFFGGFLQTSKRKKCVDMIYLKIFRNL